MLKICILISGTGTNMQALVKKAFADKLDIDFHIISDNGSAEGLVKAANLGIETHVLKTTVPGWKMTVENTDELLQLLRNIRPDYILMAGFMRILPEQVIEEYRWRIINIHPALLPSFKGKDAQKQAFEYGVKISGCTVHFADTGIDTGPVILQKAVDISQCKSVDEVKSAILVAEHETYYSAFRLLIEGRLRVEGRKVIIQ